MHVIVPRRPCALRQGSAKARNYRPRQSRYRQRRRRMTWPRDRAQSETIFYHSITRAAASLRRNLYGFWISQRPAARIHRRAIHPAAVLTSRGDVPEFFSSCHAVSPTVARARQLRPAFNRFPPGGTAGQFGQRGGHALHPRPTMAQTLIWLVALHLTVFHNRECRSRPRPRGGTLLFSGRSPRPRGRSWLTGGKRPLRWRSSGAGRDGFGSYTVFSTSSNQFRQAASADRRSSFFRRSSLPARVR